MKARPFMFSGSCSGCHTSKENRTAVAFNIDSDDDKEQGVHCSDWLCLRCARILAAKIDRAATKARECRRLGLVYRHGKWMKPAPKVG